MTLKLVAYTQIDDRAARLHQPRQAEKGPLRIRGVMQHPDTVDHVERAVGERQVHDVGLVERHVRVMAEVARRSLDGRAQIDRVDLGARVDADLREPPHPAARIEDTLAAKALERQPGLLHERVFAAGGAVGGVELRLGERVPLVPKDPV